MPDEPKRGFRDEPSDENQPGEHFFHQLAGQPGPQRESDARSIVAIAHTQERYRDLETIYALTKEAIDHLGGITAFIQAGQSVLIKPNQTGAFLADEGMTTDPRLVSALVRLCREAGAHRVIVAEGSGMDDTRVVMRITGMTAAAHACWRRSCFIRRLRLSRSGDSWRQSNPNNCASRSIARCRRDHQRLQRQDSPHDPITGALKNWVGVIGLNRGRQQHHDAHCFC